MIHSIRERDDTAELFCLAVLALISMQLLATQPSISPGHVLPSATRICPNDKHRESRLFAQSYFTSKRAYQTLNLVVLKAAMVCSASCSLPVSHIVEKLHLSRLVIQAVDIADRAAWVENERKKSQKLIEKVLLSGSRLEVRDAALQVLVAIFGHHSLPQELAPVCKAMFCLPSSDQIPHEASMKASLLLDECSVKEQLLSLLQRAADSPVNSEAMLKNRGALVLAKSLTVSVETSVSLRRHFLYLLSLDALAAPLDRFLGSSSGIAINHIDHDRCDTCPYLHAEQQLDLQRTICTLFLKVSLFAQQDEVSLDPQIGSALLEKITSIGGKLYTCERYGNYNHRRVSLSIPLCEDKGTPEKSAASGDWRSRIKTQLSRNVDQQYQSIVRTLGEACADLERRCNEIEKPLRDEQAKSSQLHTALRESRIRAQGLESHSYEQSLTVEALENEKSGWKQSIGDKERMIREQSQRVKELLLKVNEANARAEDAAQRGREKVKELDLLRSASLAEKEEALESQHQKILDIETQLGEVGARAARLQAENDVSSEEIFRLRTASTEQQTIIHETQALVSEKQVRLDQQQQIVDRLQAEGKRMQIEMERLSNDCSSMQGDLEDKIVAMGRQSVEIHDLRRHYETESSAQNNMMSELQHHSETRIQQLQVTIKENNEAAARHSRESNAKIRHLEDKLARTRKELKARDEDLEEAKELNDQITAFVNKPRRCHASSEVARIVDDNKLFHLRTSASSPQKASSETKRSKRHSYLVSATHALGTPRPSITANTPATSPKAVVFRSPFRDITTGTRAKLNTSPAQKVPSQKDLEKKLVDDQGCTENLDSEMGDASFCGSNFFTSTDQLLIAGHHDMPTHNSSEDSTTEYE
ncbi:MAG: hypothetical protein Q9183_000714 [Haloplaca sp. 2 TL-2023]